MVPRDLDVVVDELLFCPIVIADPIKEKQTTSTILVNMTLDSLPPRLEKLWKLRLLATPDHIFPQLLVSVGEKFLSVGILVCATNSNSTARRS